MLTKLQNLHLFRSVSKEMSASCQGIESVQSYSRQYNILNASDEVASELDHFDDVVAQPNPSEKAKFGVAM